MKIGIIREGKTPPDSRVPLIPEQCAYVLANFKGIDLCVQPSPIRCYSDDAYRHQNIALRADLRDRDVLLGVKEVPIGELIPGKTYFFFSHTIKEQSYNRELLRAVLDKNIRLIDYEVLTDDKGRRLIAFGKFAGMVGAHNGIMAYGARTGAFELPRMKDFLDYAEARGTYRQLQLPPMKIVLTGTGRVGNGAALVLRDMGIREASPKEFLQQEYDEAVFTQLRCEDYARRRSDGGFDKNEFYTYPERYESAFEPFAASSDLMINGIYWDNKAPAFFTREEMKAPAFRIKVIADVTCDIAPVSSIPATLRASTIADPIFGYDPVTGGETAAHQPQAIDMMTVDNLPNELPRDASKAFGKQFIEHILPELLKEHSPVIERATIAENGQLGPHFQYLKAYAGLE